MITFIKKHPAWGLVWSFVVYFLLWQLVPRAGFLAEWARMLGQGSGGVAAKVAAACIFALPIVVFMFVQNVIVFEFSRMRLAWWKLLVFLVVSLGAAYLGAWGIVWQLGIIDKMHRLPTTNELFALVGFYYGPFKMFISSAIMLAAASIGALVAVRVRDKNLLLPVVLFAAFIDVWTVTMGPVGAVLQNAPHVVSAVSAAIPQAGTHGGRFEPNTLMGPGDFLFMALVFSVVFALGLNARRNFWFVFGAMTIGMLAVMFDLVPFLPALTVLAVAVVAANWREFKLSKQEKVSVGLLAVVLLIVAILLRMAFPPLPPQPAKDQPKEKPAVTQPGVPKANP